MSQMSNRTILGIAAAGGIVGKYASKILQNWN